MMEQDPFITLEDAKLRADQFKRASRAYGRNLRQFVRWPNEPEAQIDLMDARSEYEQTYMAHSEVLWDELSMQALTDEEMEGEFDDEYIFEIYELTNRRAALTHRALEIPIGNRSVLRSLGRLAARLPGRRDPNAETQPIYAITYTPESLDDDFQSQLNILPAHSFDSEKGWFRAATESLLKTQLNTEFGAVANIADFRAAAANRR